MGNVELFTKREVALRLRLSLSTLERHIARGELATVPFGEATKACPLGRLVRITGAEIEAFVARQQERQPVESAPPVRRAPVRTRVAKSNWHEKFGIAAPRQGGSSR